MKLFQRLSIRTLILSFILTLFATFIIVANNKDVASNIATLYTNTIQQTITSLIDVAEVPESVFIAGSNTITQEQFDNLATYMYSLQPFEFFSYTPVQSVQYVYPYENYKHMIGTNGFFRPEESRLSQVALSSNETLVYLYTDTTHHEKWLIVKNPIVHKTKQRTENFMGFITVAYSINSILPNMGIEQIENLDYTYQLQLAEEDVLNIIQKSASYTDIYASKQEFTTGGSTWIFSLGIPFLKLINPLLIIIIFLSLRCIYYMYVYIRQKKLTVKKQLNYELYVDSITGAYNKKKLESLLNEKSKATLLYISLAGYDAFKDANGDLFANGLLTAYSKRVKYNVKGGMIIHLGIEEFVVFLEGEMSSDAINAVSKRIIDLSAQPFSIMGKIANVSANVGYSCMPEDSTKFTSLLNIAMERTKQ